MGKKSDGKGKEKGKGSQLVIRIDKVEREAFVTLCDQLDTSAAREIRRFMRGFVAAHGVAPGMTGEAGSREGEGAEPAGSAEARPDLPQGGEAREETAPPVPTKATPAKRPG
jgi:hypothetical protein